MEEKVTSFPGVPGFAAVPVKITVGIADLAITADHRQKIVTYALGSCVGVTVYDPVARVVGMLHYMLPSSTLSAERSVSRPCMFADTGVAKLFKGAYALGARKERLIVTAAGGAEILDDEGHFSIGERNIAMLSRLFDKNHVRLGATDLGGTHSRTMTIRGADGTVTIRTANVEKVLWGGE
jgi:chemotaxis protein CheD